MTRTDPVRILMALGLTAQTLSTQALAGPVPPHDGAGPVAARPVQLAQAPLAVPMPGAIDAQGAPAAKPDLPPAVPPQAPATASETQGETATRAQSRQVTLTLRQLGALGPLSLRGTSELQGVQFGIRSDEVVTAASLKLNGAMSPSLMPQFSNVTVTLNEQYVGTIPVQDGKASFDDLEMPVSPVFFSANNRLNFHFTGRYAEQCNDPLSGLLWSTISDTSTLTLTLVRLPPRRNLAQLPLPFFDPHERQRLSLPFVLAANPSNEALQAAGMVASWFGQQADYRGTSYPVASAAPATGNAVVLATLDALPTDVRLPHIAGPTVAVLPNPRDAAGSLLLIAGRTGAELTAAAQSLVLESRTLSGEQASVSAPAIPPRKPYDAPAWIPTDGPVKFGQLVEASNLQAAGYAPGPLLVPFRTAPDLFTWRNRGFPMEIRYRAPPGPIIDLAISRLDVGINNRYLASLPLAQDATRDSSWLPAFFQRSEVRQVLNSGDASTTRRVDVPVYDVFGSNALQFTFDSRPLARTCAGIPGDLRMAIDPDSTIDLSRAVRVASLPNLAFFINSGFPFSRMADLSETGVVLPNRPDTREIQTYLDLMGRVGSQTGYPAVRVAVVRPEEADRVADRDLLVIGTLDRFQADADLLRNSRFRLAGDRLKIRAESSWDGLKRLVGLGGEDRGPEAEAALQASAPEALAAIIGAESPLRSGRSVVAVVAGAPEALSGIAPILQDPEQAARIQGDLAVLSGGQAVSYRVGETYTVGRLPVWLRPAWLLQDSPAGLLLALVGSAILLGLACFRALARRSARRLRDAES